MRVNPPTDEQFVGIAVVEERVVAGFGSVAGVRGGGLVGNDKVVNEEGVGDEGTAENAAGFEVPQGVGVCEIEEGGAEVWREHDGAERSAGLSEGDRFEGVFRGC